MTFALPLPKRAKMTARLVGGHVDPQVGKGGVQQRFLNVGDGKYAVDVTCPPMTVYEAEDLIGALLRGQREEVTLAWTQPGRAIGAPGARTVDTLSSANATVLAVAGGANYGVRSLQFFNVIGPDGRRYLHATTQANQIPGPLAIAPALKIDATPGLVLDFATPRVQGLVQGTETAWTVDAARHYGVAFTVMESK